MLLTALTLAACAQGTPAVEAPPPAAAEAPSSTTRWVTPAPASAIAVFEAPARVVTSPQGAAAVSPPLRSRVVRVRVRPGQRVAAHEPLVDVLMPEAVQAAGALSAAAIKTEAWNKRLLQLQTLRAEGLARASEVAEVEALVATAKADQQAARATLRAAGLADESAEALLKGDGTVPLRAPLAGVVISVDALLGEVRDPGGKALVEIAGEGFGLVEARLPVDVPGGAALVFVGASGAATPLKVVSQSPRLEAKDGARLLWLEAVDAGLPVGATGRVRLVCPDSWRAVPAKAVRGDGDAAQVWVRRAEGVKPQSVKLIAKSGAEAVVDGLPAGVEVAADADEAAR